MTRSMTLRHVDVPDRPRLFNRAYKFKVASRLSLTHNIIIINLHEAGNALPLFPSPRKMERQNYDAHNNGGKSPDW